jgi:AAA domain
MLDRLYVDNFRCFVSFGCRFASKQLILGPNGGGKTTLFQVLATVRDFCVHGAPPDNLFLGYNKTRWQDVPEQSFELDVSGNDGSYTLRLVLDSWGQPARPRVVREELFFSASRSSGLPRARSIYSTTGTKKRSGILSTGSVLPWQPSRSAPKTRNCPGSSAGSVAFFWSYPIRIRCLLLRTRRRPPRAGVAPVTAAPGGDDLSRWPGSP